jgi:hypothetical protein
MAIKEWVMVIMGIIVMLGLGIDKKLASWYW